MTLPATGSPSAIDEAARDIIDAAQDQKVGIEKRALNAVSAIIRTYYPGKDKNLSIRYSKEQSGLSAKPPLQAEAKGAYGGVIYVGDEFVNSVTTKY
ncbi:MAG: hypothetical protein ACRDQZ_04930, partial [Mycobacteriales bacterium]